MYFLKLFHDIKNAPEGTGVLKQLGDKLRSYPKSRCLKQQECIDLVKSGNHAYVVVKQSTSYKLKYLTDFETKNYFTQNTFSALDGMQTDFKTAGKCDLALAKVQESAPPTAWVLPKHSPYLENINKGLHHGLYCYHCLLSVSINQEIFLFENCRITEIMDYGLLEFWTLQYQSDVRKCLDKSEKLMQVKPSSDGPPRLSLRNLTGAFVILLFGYMVALFVFVAEKLIFWAQPSAAVRRRVLK